MFMDVLEIGGANWSPALQGRNRGLVHRPENGGTTPCDSTFHRSMNTKGRDEDIPAPKQLNRYPEFVTVFRNDAAKSAR